MNKEKQDFQKLDKPLSFRIPKETHNKYKGLSGFERKTIQYKLTKHLMRLIK